MCAIIHINLSNLNDHFYKRAITFMKSFVCSEKANNLLHMRWYKLQIKCNDSISDLWETNIYLNSSMYKLLETFYR